MTDKEKLEKIKALADKMYSSMAYLTSDTRPIRQAMDEYHQFIVNEYRKEELASEDIWEASKQYALRQVLASTDTEMSEQDYLGLRLFSGFELAVAHKDGAQWQKEQMMKEAVEVPVEEAVPFGSCKWKLCAKLWLDKGVKGNKVKLVIIKEE